MTTIESTGAPRSAHACGKLILLGEHAVVYGSAALACGIDRGLTARCSPARSGGTTLRLLEECRSPNDDDLLASAFAALLAAGSGRPASPVELIVSGSLPPGMNLGFSAAAAVALATVIESLGASADEQAVRARADAWERVFHGNPSGIDVAAAMHGGVVRFRRGEPVRSMRSLRPLLFCVGLSGTKPGPTKAMVEQVASLRSTRPSAFSAGLERIAAIVADAENALDAGDLDELGRLMNRNHDVLSDWSLSTARLDALCHAARGAGALGAKLTGAGGGGAMVALAGAADEPRGRETSREVIDAFRREGCDGFEVVVSALRD